MRCRRAGEQGEPDEGDTPLSSTLGLQKRFLVLAQYSSLVKNSNRP